jgi:ribosome-associated translation inhibitor RaiA
MKIGSIVVAVSLALASGVAIANSCPKHIKAIDAALPKAKLTDAQRAEVKKYRDEGQKLHNEGKHADSLAALAKAEKILGIKM